VTPPVFDLTQRSAELDLDVPATGYRPRRAWRVPLVAAIAALLVSAAAGAAIRTLTAGSPPLALPQAELAFVEAHLDGETVATLRVTVHNAARAPVRVTSFEAEGIRDGHLSVPVDQVVPAEGTIAVRVSVSADCSRSINAKPLRAQLRFADGGTVTAVPSRDLVSAGGLCRQVRGAMPDGWLDPWPGVTIEPAGENLVLTMPPLEPGASLAGVWVGKTLLGYARAPEPVGDSYRPIVLVPPVVCLLDEESRMPTGLRILLTGHGGLRDRYVVVGPDLARWLMRRC
jgi:hypothetical protein